MGRFTACSRRYNPSNATTCATGVDPGTTLSMRGWLSATTNRVRPSRFHAAPSRAKPTRFETGRLRVELAHGHRHVAVAAQRLGQEQLGRRTLQDDDRRVRSERVAEIVDRGEEPPLRRLAADRPDGMEWEGDRGDDEHGRHGARREPDERVRVPGTQIDEAVDDHERAEDQTRNDERQEAPHHPDLVGKDAGIREIDRGDRYERGDDESLAIGAAAQHLACEQRDADDADGERQRTEIPRVPYQ